MTLYLCKMDPNEREPRFIAVLGKIVEVRAWENDRKASAPDVRYQFVPQVSGRKRSRKTWPNAVSCIPKWTARFGFCQLLDAHELEVVRRRHA